MTPIALLNWRESFNPDGTRRQAAVGQQPLSLPVIAPGATEAESGRLPPPAQAAEAAAQTPLNSPQQAMAIGEPVPVVFCRRRNNIGGVLLFPKATEAAFSNSSTQQTARYHCVLGVGPMGSIQVRDFRVGACRVGTFSQNFDKRAGTWAPGNTATVQSGYQVPTFPTACGGGGAYTGLSTLEFSNTTVGGSDDWRLGCNVFAREGLTVTRLLGGSGASDNFVDLLLWALQRSSRVPAAMIDMASFTAAARFLDVNGLFCNGEFTESGNLADFMVRMLPYFLLRETRIGGKYGLRPLVPINTDGTIDTNTLAPDWVLTESVILPGSFSQEWSDAGTRLAPRLVMMWRQQDDTSLPIVRTLHVGLGRSGPPEQHDLSQFCASEIHASRVGAYLHGRRYLSTHTANCTLLPGSQTGRINQGDVVAVNLPLITGREADGAIADWYAVESVTPAADGSETLTLSHFPVDSMARSLLALQVAGATAPGSLLPYHPIGACDVPGRSTDQSVPASSTRGSEVQFINGGSGITVGPGTTSQGSGGSGSYDTSTIPDDLPQSEAAPKSPPVNPATPGGPLKPSTELDNPDPGAYADECPNGTQTVYVRVHYAALSLSSATPTNTSIATKWGIISSAIVPSDSRDSVIINQLYYQTPQGVSTNSTVFSTRVVSNPGNPGYNVNIPLELEHYAYSCDLGGGTPGPSVNSLRYTVSKGDTLPDIASRRLGDSNRWPEIYNLNKDKIENPGLIYPGQVLKLPAS
jgi:nucleoid-associated protein YgaU